MTSGFPDPTTLHPLSDHARGVLEGIAREPVASLVVNAGVADRLFRERLIEHVELVSPFKSHQGRKVTHYKITEAGRVKLGLPPVEVPVKPKRKPRK